MIARLRFAAAAAALAIMASGPAAAHPLGQPAIDFCKGFAPRIAKLQRPIRYTDFVKLTDGEGMPISESARHWDGKNASFLNVELYKGIVKSGSIACPGGSQLDF